MSAADRPKRGAGAATAILLALMAGGALLRWRGLASQIPMDDEWHGLDFALSRDLWFLFTHFSRAGANSVAWNLYLRAALVSVGWTELTIVLPSLLAGIALLWVFPRWVLRRFGPEAAVVSSALLGLSPFLIFYSRTARAYSVVLLLESLALLGLFEWLREARRRHAVVFVAAGGLAMWAHVTAVAPLVGAAAAVLAHRLLARRQATPTAPSLRHLVLATLGMLALAGALWAFALSSPLPSPVHPPARFSWQTLAGLLAMWSGSGSLAFQLPWALAVLVGVWLLARTVRAELVALLGAMGAGLAVVLVTRPNLAGTGLMLARYLLPGFLLVILAVSVAAQALLSWAASGLGRNLRRGAVVCVLMLAYFLGPLPQIHGGANSFTKHPVFQASYGKPDPERVLPDPLDDGSTPVTRSELQPFYAQLTRAGGTAPIIEYPFLLGEDANLYYFPQRLHQRPVLAGYYRSGAGVADVFGLAVGPRVGPPAASPGYITNAMMVDHVLGRGPPDGRVRFRTVVDILDAAAVAASGAEYLLVHANLLREFFKIGPAGAGSELALRVRQSLVARYGAPVFENQLLTVLRLPRP